MVRLRRNVFESSDVGFMLVNREGTGTGIEDDYNRSLGADANLRLAGGRMLFNSYFAVTDEPAAVGDRTAGTLEVAWRDPVWDGSVLLKKVGDGFNPGVGFVRRTAIRQVYVTLGAHPQPDLPHVRELNPYVDLSLYSDLNWKLESREIKPGLGVTFLDSGLLTVEYSARFERLAETTPVAGASVPAGEYAFHAFTAGYRSDLGRKIGGNVEVTRGDFFDGDRTSVTGGISLRPNAHWFFQGTVQRNRLNLGGQRFDANLGGGRFRYGHDTRTFLQRIRSVQPGRGGATDQSPLQPDPRPAERRVRRVLGAAGPKPRTRCRSGASHRSSDHPEGHQALRLLTRA